MHKAKGCFRVLSPAELMLLFFRHIGERKIIEKFVKYL